MPYANPFTPVAIPRAIPRNLDAVSDEALISTAEAVALLGISRSTAYRMEESGQLAALRLGSRRVYRMGAVRAFIKGLEAAAVLS